MTSTEPNILWFTVRQHHRRRINTEEKAKVVVAAWGTHLNAALTIQQQGWFEEFVWGEHSFCRVVVWWNVNRMIIHFFQSIQSAMRPLFYWCFSSIPLGVKLHVWQGIETIPPPRNSYDLCLLLCIYPLPAFTIAVEIHWCSSNSHEQKTSLVRMLLGDASCLRHSGKNAVSAEQKTGRPKLR